MYAQELELLVVPVQNYLYLQGAPETKRDLPPPHTAN